MAEEIATPGPGQIRALITIAGNPVLSAPDAAKLDAALPALECMISLDNWLNETTRHAHVILPGLSRARAAALRRDASGGGRCATRASTRPRCSTRAERPRRVADPARCSPRSCQGAKPRRDRRPRAIDQLFFAGLVAAITQMPGSRIAGRDPGEIVADAGGRRPRAPARLRDPHRARGATRYGANPDGLTLAELARSRTASTWAPLEPRLPGPAHDAVGQDRARAALHHRRRRAARARASRAATTGSCSSRRRHVRSNNSWMHNVAVARHRQGPLHAARAPRRRRARRASRTASARAITLARPAQLVAPVEVSDEMMPGVVCLPHGWGHDKPGARLSVASAHAGVCNNVDRAGRARRRAVGQRDRERDPRRGGARVACLTRRRGSDSRRRCASSRVRSASSSCSSRT